MNEHLTARRMWSLFEPVHAVAYFMPRSRELFEQAGLRGFWRGYFAARVAPLGRVGPAPVLACFAHFAPRIVERALPALWELIAPDEALRVRERAAVAAVTECWRRWDRPARTWTALARRPP